MITAARLRELLDYDPATGIFRWRARKGGMAAEGSVAGSINNRGYRNITIDYRIYAAHRLAWLFMRGTWPKKNIDHRNGNSADDSWANLREATQGDNRANSKGFNILGTKGVYAEPSGKFRARIYRQGKLRHIGSFCTLAEAAEARKKVAIEFQGNFAYEAR